MRCICHVVVWGWVEGMRNVGVRDFSLRLLPCLCFNDPEEFCTATSKQVSQPANEATFCSHWTWHLKETCPVSLQVRVSICNLRSHPQLSTFASFSFRVLGFLFVLSIPVDTKEERKKNQRKKKKRIAVQGCWSLCEVWVLSRRREHVFPLNLTRLQESPLFKENTEIFFNAQTVFMHQLTSPGWRLVEKESVNLILPFRSVHLHPLCGHADSSSGRCAGSRICSFSIYSVFHVSVFHQHHWSHQHHLSCSLCFYSKLKEGGECGSWLSMSEMCWSSKPLVVYITTCT